MSCVLCGRWKCLAHAGYKGQRYAVRFSDGSTPDEHTLGWTDDPAGGALVKAIDAHPCWQNPRVVDLRPWQPKPRRVLQPFDADYEYWAKKSADADQGLKFLAWFAIGLFALGIARACVEIFWQ